jgi:hypothetical protein
MHMHTDGPGAPPLQLKLDTLLSLMPGVDPSKIDLESINALLSEAFVAEGLQADGTPNLVQIIKMPTPNGAPSFSVTVAPELFEPGHLDPLTATILLSQLQNKINENTLKTGMLKVEADRQAFESEQKKSEQAMRDADAAEDRALAAAKDAQNANIAGAVMGVIGAILAGIVAFIFGGAVLTIVFVLGAIMAAQEVINVGIKSNPKLTYDDGQGGKKQYGAGFTDLIEMDTARRIKEGSLVVATLNDKNQWVDSKGKIIQDPRLTHPNAVIMSPQQVKDMTMGLAIGLTVFMTVVMLAGGIFAIRNPVDVIKVAERLSKFMKVGDVGLTVAKAENVATIAEVVETVGSSAVQGTEAGLNERTAREQLILATANALKSHIQSMLDAQAKQMQMTQDFLHDLVEQLTESLSTVAKTIGNTFQVQHQVIQNMVTATG